MSRSPTLNTLASGTHEGMAKTSPSHASRGWARAPEFTKFSEVWTGRPAARRAPARAGSVPPLTAIVIPFEVAPTATGSKPGTARLSRTNHAASA
jgi:hypothetical protein